MWAAVIRAMSGMGRAASSAAKSAGQRAAAAARNAGQAIKGWANNRNPAGAPRGPVPPVKPQINYAAMMGQASNPNAYANAMRNAVNRAQQAHVAGSGQAARPVNAVGWMRSAMSGNPAAASNMPSLGDLTDSLFELTKSATGLTNAQDAAAKVLQGDFVGAAKDAVTAMLKMAFIVPMVGAALKKWSEGILESRRELQHFNGGIAAAFGRLDIQQFRLNLRTANATSGTTQGLAESISRLRENTQAIRELKTNLGNLLATGAAIWADRMAGALNPIVEKLNKRLEKLGIPINDSRLPAQQFIDDITKGRFAPNKDKLPAAMRLGKIP